MTSLFAKRDVEINSGHDYTKVQNHTALAEGRKNERDI